MILPRSVLRRLHPANLRASWTAIRDTGTLIAAWPDRGVVSTNWGDALNPVLIAYLSGRTPINASRVLNLANRPVHYVIGSGISNIRRPNAVIWGMGLRTAQSTPQTAPRKVLAVRGPLTRQRLIDSGIPCPERFGDPALLLPRYFQPTVKRSHRLGIVPHLLDRNSPILRTLAKSESITILDITDGIHAFVEKLLSCSAIASSSLHGLIASDSYGIPAAWIRLSPSLDADRFKFLDYVASVGRPDKEPLTVTALTPFDAIMQHCWEGPLQIDLDELLRACPFVSREEDA